MHKVVNLRSISTAALMALSRESSFGSWPSDSSKYGVQSVNSGVVSRPISPPSEAANGAMTSTHPAASQAASSAAAETDTQQVSGTLPNLMDEGKTHLNDTVATAQPHHKTSPPNTANVPTQHQTLRLSQSEKEDLKEKQSKATAATSTLAAVQAPKQKFSNVLVYDIATLLELGKGPSVTPVELERCDEDIKGKIFSISDSSGVYQLLDVQTSCARHGKQRQDANRAARAIASHRPRPESFPYSGRKTVSYVAFFFTFLFLLPENLGLT